jgi:Trypsin-like peptidase domain
MALDGHQTNAVVLITAPSTEGSRGSLEPVGTGFIVVIPSERFGDDLRHFYLVTAAHVVQSRPHEACARMRLQDGTTRDEPIPEWVFHYKYDVAAAHLDAALMFTPGDVAASNIHVEAFTNEAALGDTVFLVGLLRNMPAMGDLGIPMVRSGSVGSLWQDHILARMPGNVETELTGHLVDCRAYQGMSGSPCFVQLPERRGPMGMAAGYFPRTAFLGMIAAHFDDPQRAEILGDPDFQGSVQYRVHTGVGILTPARFVRETLDDPEFIERRQKADREEASRRQGTE